MAFKKKKQVTEFRNEVRCFFQIIITFSPYHFKKILGEELVVVGGYESKQKSVQISSKKTLE